MAEKITVSAHRGNSLIFEQDITEWTLQPEDVFNAVVFGYRESVARKEIPGGIEVRVTTSRSETIA